MTDLLLLLAAAVSATVGYFVSWWLGVALMLLYLFLPLPGWKRAVAFDEARHNRPEKIAARERKQREREAREAERRKMYEGAAHVARLADNYVERTGEVPRTADQLREQEALEDATVADRALAAWARGARLEGATEDEILAGIGGMAQLQVQLKFMNPDERDRYLESLPDEAKPTAALALAGIIEEEQRETQPPFLK